MIAMNNRTATLAMLPALFILVAGTGGTPEANAAPVVAYLETAAFVDCGFCTNSTSGVEKHSFPNGVSQGGDLECGGGPGCHVSGRGGYCDDGGHGDCPEVAPEPTADANAPAWAVAPRVSLDAVEAAVNAGDLVAIRELLDRHPMDVVVNHDRASIQVLGGCDQTVVGSFSAALDLLELLPS